MAQWDGEAPLSKVSDVLAAVSLSEMSEFLQTLSSHVGVMDCSIARVLLHGLTWECFVSQTE